MRNRNLVFGLILLILVVISHASFGHALFDPNGNIVGRTNTILKTGPCGGIARKANVKALATGSQVRVDWLETIDHPGRYEFYLSTANDANFVLLKTVIDDQNGNANMPHSYNTMLQLPANVTCTNCTLQLIQVMTENPANPTYYYACADVSIQDGVIMTPTPVPTPGPTGPAPSCH